MINTIKWHVYKSEDFGGKLAWGLTSMSWPWSQNNCLNHKKVYLYDKASYMSAIWSATADPPPLAYEWVFRLQLRVARNGQLARASLEGTDVWTHEEAIHVVIGFYSNF